MAAHRPGLNIPIKLNPEYRDYVWGGSRLRPGILPTAEAWVVYENDLVAEGPFAGQSLARIAETYREDLLGRIPVQRTGSRFPLLIKLLDSAQWLSLQVHPDDRQAETLEGPGNFGKTEAWHVIEASPDAQIIVGVEQQATHQTVAAAIQQGTILDLSRRVSVRAGDTIFLKPGTLHALGPNLLIYEVQQTSDLTYRVYDWGRPLTGGRVLHIDKSIQVVDHESRPEAVPLPPLVDGSPRILCQNRYFTLEIIAAAESSFRHTTNFDSFHAVTVLSGEVSIGTPEADLRLSTLETALIPAACDEYRLRSKSSYRLLRSRVAPN